MPNNIFTKNEKRRIKNRNVGWMDGGKKCFLVRPNDTKLMAQQIAYNYDPDLIVTGQEWVDWCPHTNDYRYKYGCDDWCERPVPRMVWVAEFLTMKNVKITVTQETSNTYG